MKADLGTIFIILIVIWFVFNMLPLIWGFLDGFLDSISGKKYDDRFNDDDEEEINEE